ncbi:MAG: hypothetical protein MJ188_03975 [Treponema sp.]|nr:hypothetical protein [Treponema sp.]
MKNTNFSLLSKLTFTALFVVSALAISSCKQPQTENPLSNSEKKPVELSADDSLIGTWSCTYDNGYVETYVITKDATDAGEYSYAGNNLKVLKTDETSGYIYIKYTRAANADWTYSETAPDVGKWYAAHYKNLTKNSISISWAYSQTGKTSTETLEEAVKEFTIENGYFGSYSDLTRKE